MIVKIKSHKRHSFEKVLEYMLNNEDRLFNEQGKSFLLTHNLKGRSIEKWVKQFKENETFRKIRRKDSVYLTHEILSWHREDARHLTLEKLEDMTREYMCLRNPRGIFVAVPHYDKSHLHVHLCASGIEYRTGKSLRLTKTQLSTLKRGIQRYEMEKYPELAKSPVSHGKGGVRRNTENEYQFKLRTGRETDKNQVISILKEAYKKAHSQKEFYAILVKSQSKTYLRSGKITGIIFNKRKYRFSRLGFTEELLNELNKIQNRNKELRHIRKNDTDKSLER